MFSEMSTQIRRDYPLNLSISISGGKETKTNSPSSGERNEKSPYTEVGEQLCSSTVWTITNECFVHGVAAPNRVGLLETAAQSGWQTDGADGAILTKISRRWVRWRMNLLQTCLCRLSFDSNLRTVHFWSISVRATFANVLLPTVMLFVVFKSTNNKRGLWKR
ncbi:Lysine-specific permease LysP [Trichinella spiralis]|uniref:Lysine-specific permease LysP n=1 Tax=Trichinella spiralis TaxID=6334 RepID=A0ABR3KYE4_TRISP